MLSQDDVMKLDNQKLSAFCQAAIMMYEAKVGLDSYDCTKPRPEETGLRSWLLKNNPHLSESKLLDEICSYAVNNRAYMRSDPENYG